MNRQYGALSGVAILLIVMNHTVHFGLQLAPAEGAWFKALVVVQALGSFAVPVFLFVSGAFVAYAARELTTTLVRTSLERILWPYLFWSTMFYVLLFLTSGERYAPAGYLKNLTVGYPYHFVPLLVAWYLAAPALIWAGRRHGAWLLAGIATWQVWLLLVRFPEMFGLEGRLPSWAAATAPPVLSTSMADWALYFPMGLVMSLHGAALKPWLERWRGAAAAATLLLFGLGLANAFGLASAPWARLAVPLPFMLLLPTIDRQRIPFYASFEWLGRRSYGIYLSHFVVINAIVAVLGPVTPVAGSWNVIVYPVLLVATLALSLVAMEVTLKTMAGRRVYRYTFGNLPAGSARPLPQRS